MTDVHEMDIRGRSAARVARIDPLVAIGAPPDDARRISVPGAVGWAVEEHLDPEAMEASWGKLHQFTLQPEWLGDPASLVALLDEWVAEIQAANPGLESQAVVKWPSRDIDAARVLRDHGFAPTSTIAICVHRPADSPPTPPHNACRVRHAEPGDLDVVVDLWLEQLEYPAGLDSTTIRPSTKPSGQDWFAAVLDSGPWVWVAETDSRLVGLLRAATPELARIPIPTTQLPAHWLPVMAVASGYRGVGVGSALVSEATREFKSAGMAATVLGYTTFNPLSVPFWSRHGYRPLYSWWSAWPADTLR